MAKLVLLAAPARARIVPSELPTRLDRLAARAAAVHRSDLHARARLLPGERDMEDRVGHVVLDRAEQLVEHPCSFDLVLDERVPLAVGAKADTVPEVVESRQVPDPEAI